MCGAFGATYAVRLGGSESQTDSAGRYTCKNAACIQYGFTEDTDPENSNSIGKPVGIGWSRVAVAALRMGQPLELSWEKGVYVVAGAVIAEALPSSAQGQCTKELSAALP